MQPQLPYVKLSGQTLGLVAKPQHGAIINTTLVSYLVTEADFR